MTAHYDAGNRVPQLESASSSSVRDTSDGFGAVSIALTHPEGSVAKRPVIDPGHSIGHRLLAYVVPVALALLAVQTWFRPGTVIAQGDLTPPFLSSTTSISSWNYVSGQGGPSYAIVQAPTTVGIRAASAMGISPELFQRLWISLLFAGVAASVVYYAFGLFEDPVAAGAAGIFASFNAFRLTTGSDPIPLATICVAAILGGLLLRVRDGRTEFRRIASFALLSMGVSYLAVNPPQVVLVAGWMLVSIVLGAVLWHRDYVVAVGRFAVRAVPLALLLNLWWLVPAVLTLRDPSFAARFAAGDPSSWAWTHVRATLTNAFALNTTWAWTHSAYFPYSNALDGGVAGLLRFALPLLGAVGLIRAAQRRPRLAAALIVVWGITLWVAKGYHAPLAGTNEWLYQYVPGYWLFRDPAKVVGVTTIVVALLAGLAVGDAWRERRRGAGGLSYSLCVAALIAGSLVYVRPMFVGSVVPDRRPLLPSSHVVVPDAWTDVGPYLDSLPSTGSVLVLPMSDYYQLPTTWGYYGASFTPSVTAKPVIDLADGGYFRGYGSAPVLVSAIEQRLLDDRARRDVVPLMRALGVGYVLVRRDLDYAFPGRRLAGYSAIERGLQHTKGIRLLRSFGLLDVYAVNSSDSRRVQAAVPVTFDGPIDSIPTALSLLPAGTAVVPASNSEPGHNAGPSPGTLSLSAGQGPHEFRLRARRFEHLTVLRLSETPGLDDAVSGSTPSVWWVTIAGPETPGWFRVDGHRVSLADLAPHWSPFGRVRTSGETILRFPSIGRRTEVDPVRAGPVGDCDRYDDRSGQELGLSSSVFLRNLSLILRLTASDHSACVGIPVHPFVSGGSYRVSVSYRSIVGARARFCLLETPTNACLETTRLKNDHEWHTLRTTATTSSTSSSLTLYLYADASRTHGTTTAYRDISFRAFPAIHVAARPSPGPLSPHVTVDPISASEIHVHVEGAESGSETTLVLSEAYAPGWELTSGSRSVAGVRHITADGYANAWRIPWTGSYDVTLRYAPEELAHRARILDLVLVPIVLALAVAAPLVRRNRGLRRLLDRIWRRLTRPTRRRSPSSS
jgi:arabinofuranan 3-O-arabinosyltransferase